MNRTQKILIVDDDADIRGLYRDLLLSDGYNVIEAGNGKEALKTISEQHPVLMLLDIDMPVMGGLEVLSRLKKENYNIPVIVITGYGSMEIAIRAVRDGAYEYLTKPTDNEKVLTLVKRCLQEQSMKSELEELRKYLPGPSDRHELVGASAVMVEIFKTIGAIAGTTNQNTVLITGESGTGKELVAQQIHKWGEHADQPFVGLNMTALPDSLLESELFGYEKGAFTGASRPKAGKFELAGEGTIFLDEIGDLSLDLQKKLLRVLQERECVRLGGHEIIPVRARFVAATNKDLEERVEQGKFREDLFFRLNVVRLDLPPLRERKEDIPDLATHFVEKIAHRFNHPIVALSPETMAYLMDYDWPGNVRELENALARAMVIRQSNKLLPQDIAIDKNKGERRKQDRLFQLSMKDARAKLLEDFDKRYLQTKLAEADGNITRAAKLAGIGRQSFHRLLHQYGLDKKK